MTTREVAAALGVSLNTVHRLAQRDELPVVAKAPGVRGGFTFDRAGIVALVEQRAAEARARLEEVTA